MTEDTSGVGRSRAARRSHQRHRGAGRLPLVALAAAAAALALVGLLVHGLERLSDRAGTVTPSAAGPIVVVEGEVNEPGPRPLEDGATLCDLWSAAGGALEVEAGECDRRARSGIRLRLEGGRFQVTDLTPEERFAVGLRLDLNHAREDELETVPGLSEVLAGRVAMERDNGPFCSVDDLSRVRGIGARKVEYLRPFLEVVGTPEGCGDPP